MKTKPLTSIFNAPEGGYEVIVWGNGAEKFNFETRAEVDAFLEAL